MSSIQFSKEQLQDLNSSLSREFLLSNHNGSYCSSTLINCHTRKYHGLLVAPQPAVDANKHVLLSCVDETILYGTKKIPLATHCYPNTIHPHGYLHLNEFSYERLPHWTIKADSIEIRKEIALVSNEDRVLIRYIVKESNVPFILQVNPFLAFRSIHSVNKPNGSVDNRTEKIGHGIKLKIYPDRSTLFLQFSKRNIFIPVPTWNNNNEYKEERERGYEYLEDLYCPGHFLVSLKKGDQLIFSAGLTEANSRKLRGVFDLQLRKSKPMQNLSNYLENAAKQFIIKTRKGTEVIAGFPWFGQWGRDTFIALPGLTLSVNKPRICKAVLDTMRKDLKEGLFPNMIDPNGSSYNTADASLWFFWALQQYANHTKTTSKIWDEYGSDIRSILLNYRRGTKHHIHMKKNGLLYAGEEGVAITWMDAVVNGKAITPRIGMTVELNALWYNAICFAMEVAASANDENFIAEWGPISESIES